MTRFTARIVGPEELTLTELSKALESVGCHLEAQPMLINRPVRFREEPLIPSCHLPSTSPDQAIGDA